MLEETFTSTKEKKIIVWCGIGSTEGAGGETG